MKNGVDTPLPIRWPRKVDVFGVQLSCTNYEEITDLILAAAESKVSFVVDFLAVDPLVQAARSPQLREMINGFEVACPDGHPVRIAMNHLCGAGLEDRVCGPDTCEILLLKASQQGISVFFYGSTPQTLEALEKNVLLRWPQLKIAGTHSPPFRPLTPGEEDEVANRINASGAGLVFIGLGAPRQSIFAARMQEKIHAGMLCVGAAFDFLAKTKRRAPQWMQKSGMEWFYRLVQEPRRLARRYTLTNSLFLLLLLRASLTGSRS